MDAVLEKLQGISKILLDAVFGKHVSRAGFDLEFKRNAGGEGEL